MKKWLRSAYAAMFAMVLMLSTVVPSLAAEQQTPQISNWAVAELTEGEKYGIFPLEWYYDRFTEDISSERLEWLLSHTKAKIAQLDLNLNEDFVRTDINLSTTRENILSELYQIVAQYDLPVGDSAIAYMEERGIIRGTSNGLELDKPATTEEAVLFAARLVQDIYKEADAGSKGVAWKVEHNGNLIYLLGSIHLGTPDIYPFNESLLAAFHESEALLVEANLFDMEGLQYFTNASVYQDGTTLKDVVSEETYGKVLQALEKYGMPEEAISMYKPWTVASLFSNLALSESTGISPDQMANSGIDMYFLSNAVLTQTPIIELEGMKAQTDMFEGLSSEAQEQYLAETLDSILNPDAEAVNEGKLLQEWLEHWSNGNIDAFKESFNELDGEPSEFEAMLFGERDQNMAAKIAELLESDEQGTYFLVVGAGHFLTPESILYHLEAKGYTIEEFYQ